MILEIVLSIETKIILLQKPFIDNQELIYNSFNFYEQQANRTESKNMTVVRRDLLDKIIVEHRIDLINYLYFMLFKIQDLDQQL